MEPFTDEYMEEQTKIYGQLNVFDDIISLRAADSPSANVFAYPSDENVTGFYETFTAAQLNGFIDAAVKKLMKLGYEPVSLPLQQNFTHTLTLFRNLVALSVSSE